MKQRLREMDLIRAVSALSIIVIHVTGIYAYSSRGAYYLNQFVRYAVPVFILISGLLLSLSGYEYKGISGYLKFLAKRLKKIYIPYLVWSFVYILYNMRNEISTFLVTGLLPAAPTGLLHDTARKLFYGTGYLHLYFVIIIVQLYFLFPLLKYLMKKWTEAVLALSLILTLVYQTGVYLQLLKVITFPVFFLPNYVFFPTWIFYFVLGMYFAANFDRLRLHIQGKPVFIAAAWLVSLAVLLVDNRLTNTFSSSIKPTIMLYSITSFLFMYLIALKVKDSRLQIFKLLDWVSCQSFLIYFSHLLVMNIIKIISWRLGFNNLWNGFAGMLMLYLATTLGTCLFAWVMSFTPVASVIGGVKRAGGNAAHAMQKNVGS